MSTPRKQLTTPRVNSSTDYQDFIQSKILTIKSAIDKIKQSESKSAREQNSCEQTPRVDVLSNISRKYEAHKSDQSDGHQDDLGLFGETTDNRLPS